jgi:hypothetical protein
LNLDLPRHFSLAFELSITSRGAGRSDAAEGGWGYSMALRIEKLSEANCPLRASRPDSPRGHWYLHNSRRVVFRVLCPPWGNAVKHFSTDFVRVALALPVVCHPITGYDTGKASATQDKFFANRPPKMLHSVARGERVRRVPKRSFGRGTSYADIQPLPLIRPSATFSPKGEKG